MASLCLPQQQHWHQPFGSSQIDTEGGIEEPYASLSLETTASVVVSPSMQLMETGKTLSYGELVSLLEDVHALKRNSLETSRHAVQIAHLRRELDDMKCRVDLLAKKCPKGAQDLQVGLGPSGSDQVNDKAKRSISPNDENNIDTMAATYTAMNQEKQSRESVQQRKERGVRITAVEREVQDAYRFGQSTWDMAIFIGTKAVGVGGDALACLLLLMNVIMQLVFAGIAWFNLSEASVGEETIKGAQRWRLSYAHDYQFLDRQTGYSLVARVCNHDSSLHVAGRQEALYKTVESYLRLDATGVLESICVGKVLSIVALICWFLMISKEAHKCLDLFRGVVFLDSGPDKLEPVERPGFTTTYRVVQFSRPRKIFAVTIVCCRLLVAGLLAYCGTHFIVYTIEITELVLNAVALEVILKIDELLFEALAAPTARDLILKLEPLKMPLLPHRKGMDLKACSMVLLILSAALVVYLCEIVPMVDDLSEVAEALCGGNTDFVFADDILRLTLFSPTTPCAGHCVPDSVSNSVKIFATVEAIYQSSFAHRNSSEYALWLPHVTELKARQTLTVAEASSTINKDRCSDKSDVPYLHYMREVFDNQSISTCADVRIWCSSLSFLPQWSPDGGKGVFARVFCPHTCQCNHPAGAIAYSNGCPMHCRETAHQTFYHYLNTSTCQDASKNHSSNSTDWMSWVSQIRAYGLFSSKNAVVALADHLGKHGCTNVAVTHAHVQTAKCEWKQGLNEVFKSIAHFCPDACGCSTNPHNRACPVACHHRRRIRPV